MSECTDLVERFVADGALVLLLGGVRQSVVLVVALLVETFPAHLQRSVLR